MRVSACFVLCVALAACGDNLAAPSPDAPVAPDAAPADILAELSAIPGVTATEWFPDPTTHVEPGYRYFDLWFTQPIDHHAPAAGTFRQYVALMHRDVEAPLVVFTSGYDAAWTRSLTEPASLLAANQISLEYRFYGQSRPATIDWSKLNVEQSMADEHAILTALAPIYRGKTIESGGSKGGENALAHMFLYPGDLDGVVAYVAPVITDKPDLRYATVLDDIGLASCRTALRALQREMLMRRTMLETRAAAQHAYAIAGVAHATETSIVELEFAFWMTRGEPACASVPPTSASDAALWSFLEATSGPEGYDDDALRISASQYIFQDQTELGYPIWEHAHLDDLLHFSYEDWSAYLPAPVTSYDPSGPRALAAWLRTAPSHVMQIGGEWDPWGAGYPTIATGPDALDLRVPHGSHWSSGIYSLTPTDQALAVTTLRRWAGLPAAATLVVPPPPASIVSRGPRMPPR